MNVSSIRRAPRHRGIILLMVLAMLALFSLLVASYVVFTGRSREAAEAINRRETREVDGSVLIDLAMQQVIGGTSDTASGLFGNGMLEDLYGNTDTVHAEVASLGLNYPPNTFVPPAGGPHTLFSGHYLRMKLGNVSGGFAVDAPGALSGRVLSLTNGPLEDLSFYIVDSRRIGAALWVTVDISPHYAAEINVPGRGATTLHQSLQQPANTDQIDDRRGFLEVRNLLYDNGITIQGYDVLINGRAQNSTGYGWANDGSGEYNINALRSLYTGKPFQLNDALAINYSWNGVLPGGDADEPIDVPDYRDAWLGFYPVDNHNSVGQLGDIAPSFVRPGLLNYMLQLPDTNFPGSTPNPTQERVRAQSLVNALNLITMRPLPVVGGAFENFTGGNSYLGGPLNPALSDADYLNQVLTYYQRLRDGPWDVDNDNDGTSDSVWIDANLPKITTVDGAQVYPLIALRIEDLNSRVDVNASGNAELSTGASVSTSVLGPYAGSMGTSFDQVFSGFGYGPADLSLRTLFAAQHDELLAWRLGYDAVPGTLGNDRVNQYRFPWRTPLQDFVVNNSGTAAGIRSNYGLTVDVFGRSKLALDPYGQPIAPPEIRTTAGIANSNEQVNDPYEMAITANRSPDRSFSLAELETILRYYDWDRSQLPEGLVNLIHLEANANGSARVEAIRRAITAYSSSRQHVGGTLPSILPSTGTTPVGADPIVVLRALITSANADQTLREILPFEMFRGETFNLNRPFGDGVDGDGNGVVDDPQELAANNEKAPGTMITADYTPGSNEAPRQLYAKNLYCMAMMMTAPEIGSNKFDFRLDQASAPPHPTEEQARAQRLAQWAVNVVDFRDRDAIMTRFVYDEDPLDGWDVSAPTSPVVFGVESPELLLTESFAIHDRGTRDTDVDDGADPTDANNNPNKLTTDGTDPDGKYDQYRVPQGSLFLELYSCRNPSVQKFGTGATANFASVAQSPPPELYSIENDGTVKLDLGRLSTDGVNPVWRVTIMQNRDADGDAAIDSPDRKLSAMTATEYDSLSFRPEQDSNRYNNEGNDPGQVLGTAGAAGKYDRVIWFTDAAPAPADIGKLPTDTEAQRIYYNRLGNQPLLEGGAYAVVGSRATTYVGSKQTAAPNDPPPPIYGDHVSDQKIELTATSFDVKIAGTVLSGSHAGNVREVLGMVAAADAVGPWTDANAADVDNSPGFGISVSEPRPDNYSAYRVPTMQLNSAGGSGYPIDSWYDYDTATGSLPDAPFDLQPGTPLGDASLTSESTELDFATAYLQRLADPTKDYHSTNNPYISVDWIPIDLTIYNGEDAAENAGGGYRFASRGKDGLGNTASNGSTAKFVATDNVIWSYSTGDPVTTVKQTSLTGDYFGHAVGITVDGGGTNATIGYLNQEFGTPYLNGDPVVTAYPAYAGAPKSDRPFPWLTILNREFASPYELMMVPASSPDRLMLEFSLPKDTEDPYADEDGPAPVNLVENDYDHLLNFFSSSTFDGDHSKAPDLYQIFEFVGLPNPYDDGHVLFNPAAANSMAGREIYATPANQAERVLLPTFDIPFNYSHNPFFRGRPNINTIASVDVWRELMASHSLTGETNGAFFNEWLLSRRVPDETGVLDGSDYHNQSPTQFPGAFVPGSAGWLAPKMMDDYGANDRLRRDGIDGTLLRRLHVGGTAPADPNRPLLSHNASGSTNVIAHDPHREAFFRYQTAMRTANLVSTNSQAFAVWITVGLFDVDTNTGQVGEEHGFAEGENERFRAFYIIDRSVPVPYEQNGQHSFDRTILLKRVLK